MTTTFGGNFGREFGELDKALAEINDIRAKHQATIDKLYKAMTDAERASLDAQRQRAEALRAVEAIENGAKTVTAEAYHEARRHVDWLSIEAQRRVEEYADANRAWHDASEARLRAIVKARSAAVSRLRQLAPAAEEYLRQL